MTLLTLNFQEISLPPDMSPCNNTGNRRYYENSLPLVSLIGQLSQLFCRPTINFNIT
jgi:hypothetical protein